MTEKEARTREQFIFAVKAKLASLGLSDILSNKEEQLIDIAIEYEVGPMDTAYQIESDRLDAKKENN